MKVTAWVLSTAVTLGLASGCKTSEPAPQVKPVVAGTQPLFTPESASLAQQKMCDEQAEKKYKEERYSDFDKKDNLPLTSYNSHYDPTVNVCYVRVKSFGGSVPSGIMDTVYDAFSGRVFASYIWINPLKEKSSEVAPSECDINIPGKPVERCSSFDEFKESTERYFGVTE